MGLKPTTLYLSAGLLLGSACLWVQGPLPGDVVVARTLQSLLGNAPAWAKFITDSAKWPALWATLGVALLVASLHKDWRITSTPAVALPLAYLLDIVLRAFLFAPRPLPDLIAVAAQSSSSGLPSTLGLVYGALFGVGLVEVSKLNNLERAAFILSLLLTLAGASARIVLGGHWPSQMMASMLAGIALSGGVNTAFHSWFGK